MEKSRTQVKEEAKRLYRMSLNRVAEIIKAKRKEKQLTLREMFDLSGVSTTVLSDLENKQYLPRLEVVFRLFTALGISVKDLTGVELGNPKKEPYIDLRKDLNRLPLGVNDVEEIIKYVKFRELK